MSATAPPDPPDTRPRFAPPERRRLHLGAPAGWRSTLREFAIIVAGVLAALGAQAWWENRQERERERAYLAQVLAETRENEERLAEAIAEDSVAGIYTDRVMVALEGPGPAPPADSLVRWIGQAGRASDFQPVTGAYRALLGTGDLRLVRNDSLRAVMVAYAAALDSESARLQQYRGVILDAVPGLARAFPFMRRIFTDGLEPGGVDVERLRRDPEVATVVFTLQAANVNRLSGLRRVRGETERVRRALEAEPLP
jgi:hypothetical protein